MVEKESINYTGTDFARFYQTKKETKYNNGVNINNIICCYAVQMCMVQLILISWAGQLTG